VLPPAADGLPGLRIALLSYRSAPHSGGQGIYVRQLARHLHEQGHRVTVVSGPPYPQLDDGPTLVRLPSLDLYRQPDPFRTPHPREFRDAVDVLEYLTMCTAGFPEPLTFSLRARRWLAPRLGDFDLVHDNQSLGLGLLPVRRAGLPVVATIHHPVTVDRDLELAVAGFWRRQTLRRWYGFVRLQRVVAPRLDGVVTVSEASRTDVAAAFGLDPAALAVVPVGVDTDVFAPPAGPRVPGRVVTTASADVALKGLVPLLQAVAKVAVERPVELVLVGRLRRGSAGAAAIDELGLHDVVRVVSDVPEAELVALLGSAQVAVVPSLYEGFGLPAIEAMACATPLVASAAGALPEVVGDAGVLVPPGDPEALAAALGALLDDPERRDVLGAAGLARARTSFGWPATAARTAAWYRRVLARRDRR
jgi:glycosyltransferase involved in cell wall biosynthesis